MRREFLKFHVGDVEDPDMMANYCVADWHDKNKEAYEYLMEHSDGRVYIVRQEGDLTMFNGHVYHMEAEMTEEDWFLYCMRFENVSRYSRSSS